MITQQKKQRKKMFVQAATFRIFSQVGYRRLFRWINCRVFCIDKRYFAVVNILATFNLQKKDRILTFFK